jgi:hypothetical protein
VKKKIQELNTRLEQLHERRNGVLAGKLLARDGLSRAQAALNKLQAEGDRDAQQNAAKKTWFAYFFSRSESEQDKEEWGRRKTERWTGRIVLEAERDRQKLSVSSLERILQQLDTEVESIRLTKISEEQREKLRLERIQREQREERE